MEEKAQKKRRIMSDWDEGADRAGAESSRAAKSGDWSGLVGKRPAKDTPKQRAAERISQPRKKLTIFLALFAGLDGGAGEQKTAYGADQFRIW